MFFVTELIQIPWSELELSYARSSGPGGQNVNKVNSKALLRWNLAESSAIPPEIRAKLMRRLENRMTLSGEIIVSSDRFRDQIRNREDCFEKLREMVQAGLAEPKIRKKSKPTRSSIRQAKESKTRQSRKKNLRRNPRHED